MHVLRYLIWYDYSDTPSSNCMWLYVKKLIMKPVSSVQALASFPSHVTACAHVPAFVGTSISSILTFHQHVFVQSQEAASTY